MTNTHYALLSALRPLHEIANAFDRNELDDEARKTWGQRQEMKNVMPHDQIELVTTSGGGCLLSLADCMAARHAIRTETGLEEALQPLLKIADAYHANRLDDEARKHWGRDLQHTNTHAPSEIELYEGRGGKCLLTLEHAFAAVEVARPATSAENAATAQDTDQPASDQQDASLKIALAALEDISEGRGMFGVSTKADLAWAMEHAAKAVAALSVRTTVSQA